MKGVNGAHFGVFFQGTEDTCKDVSVEDGKKKGERGTGWVKDVWG